MKEFDCPEIGITTTRGVVEAFLAAFGSYRARGERILARHLGVAAIDGDPAARVSLTGLLRAMRELQEQFGAPFMRKVGTFIFDKAAFPPGIDSIEKAVAMGDTAYLMNHSPEAAGRIGGYVMTAGPRRMTVVSDIPYPCAFDLGVMETIVRRFEPSAQVDHRPGGCRHHGADACTYVITW